MSNLSDCVPAVVVYWTESERGWGQRPDGLTIFVDLESANAGIKQYWEREKQINPSGAVPECYSFPSEPTICAVTEEIHGQIDPVEGYTTPENSPSWLIDR